MLQSEAVSPEVVVGTVIGLPSLLIALTSLYVGYLSMVHTRETSRRDIPDPTPLLPLHYGHLEILDYPRLETPIPNSPLLLPTIPITPA